MKKQPHITEQTKANLRTAFWQLYTEKPLDKISIKEITDLAGYNRGTFYLYYKDVYDIFNQIEDELLQKIEAVLHETLVSSEIFDLSQQMGVLMELMQTHSHYATVLLSDHGDPRFMSRLKDILRPFLNHYFLSTDRLTDYEQELLSEFYLSGLLASVRRWLANPKLPLDEFIAFMVPNVFGTDRTVYHNSASS